MVIITAVIIILGIILAFLLGACIYKTGISDGLKLAKGEVLTDTRKERPQKKQKPQKDTQDDILQNNILNYNGTAEGQIKI